MLVYAVGLLGGYLQKFSNFQLTDERQRRCERADHDDGGIEMTWKRIVLAICALACCTVSCLGQDLGKVSRAEDIGFSTERLVRITKFFQSDVDKGAIPGAVVLVTRDGKLVYQDREKRIAMKPDAIFRIASMTKPITSVAVMMLAEEGKIDLIAPAAQYLPELKDVKVSVERTEGSTGKTTLTFEDPTRSITVQDLLRHTSGLMYGPFGNSLVHQAYNKGNLFDGSQTF